MIAKNPDNNQWHIGCDAEGCKETDHAVEHDVCPFCGKKLKSDSNCFSCDCRGRRNTWNYVKPMGGWRGFGVGDFMSKEMFIKVCRMKGWRIGMHDLCPSHARDLDKKLHFAYVRDAR